MAQLNITNYPISPLKYITGLDASGNVKHALAPKVSVKDYGAKGDGTTDDTSAIKAAFDACMAAGVAVQFEEGTYLVTGPITTLADSTNSLHIVCKGQVNINVSGSATAFNYLLYVSSTVANNASITGGQLRIDLNNKCGSGIWIQHAVTGPTGVVNIQTPVTVLNAKQNNSSFTQENYGIGVIGDYEKVIMQQPTVVGVNRTNTTGGACKGIVVTQCGGEVVLNQPHVENILTPGTADADGIATFGKLNGGSSSLRTAGRVTINQPVFIDCQGRSFKSQCSDTTIIRPRVYRKSVVAIAQAVEFDFQLGGNHLLIEPDYEYRLNGATSPIGSSHSCVAFQNMITDTPMHSRSVGGYMRTEVQIPNYCVLGRATSAAFCEVVVEGLRIIPLGSFTSATFSRSLLEFIASDLIAATGKTMIRVDNCSGPLQCTAIGYNSYSSGTTNTKLDIEVTNMRNTMGPASAAQLFNALSGSFINDVDTFLFRSNTGYRDLNQIGTFNFNKLRPGCIFTVDPATVTATGAPPWSTASYATVECLTAYFGTTDRTVRVTQSNGSGVWFTQNGGTNWGTTA
jgi:hypothetical protein